MLLLFRMSGEGVSHGEEYVLLQYMDCSDPLDDIYKRLGSIRLRWSSDYEMDHTQGTERAWRKGRLPVVVKVFGLELFSSIRGSLTVELS